MIVAGDLLKAKVDIIVQQVNCSGRMGAGLSGEILTKYSNVKNHYLGFIRSNMTGSDKRSLLGKVNYIDVYDGKIVANVFAQVDVKKNKKDTGKYTEENYLLEGIEEIFRYAKWRGFSVGLPFKIGCDLGGGDWDTVYSGIIELVKEYEIDCKIYDIKRGIWEDYR